MIDERREKINKLKKQIKETNVELESKAGLLGHLTKSPVGEEGSKVKEQSEKIKKDLKEGLEKDKAEKARLIEELKLVRMNKNNSKFFEWIPSKGNRRAARQYRNLYSKQLRRQT